MTKAASTPKIVDARKTEKSSIAQASNSPSKKALAVSAVGSGQKPIRTVPASSTIAAKPAQSGKSQTIPKAKASSSSQMEEPTKTIAETPTVPKTSAKAKTTQPSSYSNSKAILKSTEDGMLKKPSKAPVSRIAATVQAPPRQKIDKIWIDNTQVLYDHIQEKKLPLQAADEHGNNICHVALRQSALAMNFNSTTPDFNQHCFEMLWQLFDQAEPSQVVELFNTLNAEAQTPCGYAGFPEFFKDVFLAEYQANTTKATAQDAPSCDSTLPKSFFQRQIEGTITAYRASSAYKGRAEQENPTPVVKSSAFFSFSTASYFPYSEEQMQIFRHRKQVLSSIESALKAAVLYHNDAILEDTIRSLSINTFRIKEHTGALNRSSLFNTLNSHLEHYQQMEALVSTPRKLALIKLEELRLAVEKIQYKPYPDVEELDGTCSSAFSTIFGKEPAFYTDNSALIKRIQTSYQEVIQAERTIRQRCEHQTLECIPLLEVPKKDAFESKTATLKLINELICKIKSDEVLSYAFDSGSANSQLVALIKHCYKTHTTGSQTIMILRNEIAESIQIVERHIKENAVLRCEKEQLKDHENDEEIESSSWGNQKRV